MAQVQRQEDQNMLKFFLNLEQRTWWVHCQRNSKGIVSVKAFPSTPVDNISDGVKTIIEQSVQRLGYKGIPTYSTEPKDYTA